MTHDGVFHSGLLSWNLKQIWVKRKKYNTPRCNRRQRVGLLFCFIVSQKNHYKTKSSWASLILFVFVSVCNFCQWPFYPWFCRFVSILQIDQFFIRKKNETLFIPFFCSLNFLKLKVYYGQLNFEVLDEEYAYTVRNYSFLFLIIKFRQIPVSYHSRSLCDHAKLSSQTGRRRVGGNVAWASRCVSVACVSIQNGGKSLIR